MDGKDVFEDSLPAGKKWSIKWLWLLLFPVVCGVLANWTTGALEPYKIMVTDWIKRIPWGVWCGLGIIIANGACWLVSSGYFKKLLSGKEKEWEADRAALKAILDTERAALEASWEMERAALNEKREPSILATEGHMLTLLRSLIHGAQKNVWICLLEKENWFFTLLSTLFICRSRGVELTVIVKESQLIDHERYQFIELMGGILKMVPTSVGKAPFSGVLVDTGDIRDGRAIAISIKEEAFFAKSYNGLEDYYAIKSMHHEVSRISRDATLIANNGHVPSFEEATLEEIRSRLKNGEFYRDSHFNIELVKIQDLWPISPTVQTAKVDQAGELLKTYDNMGLAVFEPMAVILSTGQRSLIVPPVVELHMHPKLKTNQLVIAEGHSRLYHLHKRANVEEAHVIVIRNVLGGPASDPMRWDSVRELPSKAKIHNLKLARHIETLCHVGLTREKKVESGN